MAESRGESITDTIEREKRVLAVNKGRIRGQSVTDTVERSKRLLLVDNGRK